MEFFVVTYIMSGKYNGGPTIFIQRTQTLLYPHSCFALPKLTCLLVCYTHHFGLVTLIATEAHQYPVLNIRLYVIYTVGFYQLYEVIEAVFYRSFGCWSSLKPRHRPFQRHYGANTYTPGGHAGRPNMSYWYDPTQIEESSLINSLQSRGLPDLPFEIRQMIFQVVVVFEKKRFLLEAPPALTMTSRGVRREALEIYYGQNHFIVRISGDPCDPDQGRDNIKRIYDNHLPRWYPVDDKASKSVLSLVKNIDIRVVQFESWANPSFVHPNPDTLTYFYVYWNIQMSSASASQQLPAPAPTLHFWHRIGDENMDWKDWAASFSAYIAVCNDVKRHATRRLGPWRPLMDRQSEIYPHYFQSDLCATNCLDNFIDLAWLVLSKLVQECPKATRSVDLCFFNCLTPIPYACWTMMTEMDSPRGHR